MQERGSMKRLTRDDGLVYAFRPDIKPILSVRPGEVIEFVCEDSCGGQIRSEADTLDKLDFSRVNGATGPVEIIGAQPGDAVKVTILDIRTSSLGFQAIEPGYGVLGDQVPAPRTKFIPIRRGVAQFSRRIRLPVRPHVGTIGVAPRQGEWTTFFPGDHGGNLDTKEVATGNAIYLPVFQPGACLAVGDIHALMADGEVCVTGIEVEGTVRARLQLLRRMGLERPVVETRDSWLALASAPTLEEAAKLATRDGVALLARGARLAWEDAYMLASISCDLRISQLVDPWRTAKLAIPKAILPRLVSASAAG